MAATRTALQHQRQPNQLEQTVPHGTKRPAETALENDQRLSKRFDLLNLVENNGSCLYIPVPGSSDNVSTATKALPRSIAPAPSKRNKEKKKPRAPPADDVMQVEDTPHKVYIHDLAAELSDIESDEENPIFLSDIEKHLSKIPKHILTGPEPKPTEHNQIVLYNVPSSLTVPEERDSVRKAIVDARARMRERQASGVEELEHGRGAGVLGATMDTYPPVTAPMSMAAEEDQDAMDLDDV